MIVMTAVSIGQSIVLGIVEGLTEFLPVSSTAHLRLTEAALGLPVKDPGVVGFTAVVQLGAVAAVLLYFADDAVRVLRAALGRPDPDRPASDWDARLGWWIVLGTIPVVVVGVAAAPLITGPLAALTVVAVSLVLGSVWMVAGELVGRQQRHAPAATMRDVVLMGTAQVLSLVLPGFSRSGATISAGLICGLDRLTATRLSFLLSLPALLGAGLYELKDVAGSDVAPLPVLIGTATAFLVALLTVAVLLRVVARVSLSWFVGYRLALALVVGVLLATGSLT